MQVKAFATRGRRSAQSASLPCQDDDGLTCVLQNPQSKPHTPGSQNTTAFGHGAFKEITTVK